MPDENRVADDNVSFTDVGDPTGGGARQGSSGMLDLLGSLEKKKEAKKNKKKKATKKKKKEKTKYKKVRKVDKYESQNFLYRVEGSMFCAGISEFQQFKLKISNVFSRWIDHDSDIYHSWNRLLSENQWKYG